MNVETLSGRTAAVQGIMKEYAIDILALRETKASELALPGTRSAFGRAGFEYHGGDRDARQQKRGQRRRGDRDTTPMQPR